MHTLRLSLQLILLLALTPSGARCDDLRLDSFSDSSFGKWVATGDAFQDGPAAQQDYAALEITNTSTAAIASSEKKGDGPTGVLTSPEFRIERPFIAFRIAGGNYEHATCLNLMVKGRVVRSATGWRSDRLVAASWDVREFQDETAKLQIVDDATGDWGHVNVSHIVQTDTPERPPIPLERLYHESLRPQFHFTARQWTMRRLNPGMREEGWINDLNGLIFYDGEYHLFAQRWAKCWLHAVSKDLVHWQELEPAFWEESLGSGVQSGTCIVDYANTSGLSRDKSTPPLIAFWSRFDNKSQCLSYSLDHGRTWHYYDKNPFLEFPERDPKVFWYAPKKHWVMMLYGQGKYHLFTSTNLLEWTNTEHPIENCFECPDFFELPIDGDPSRKKWVLIQGNGQYSLGEFDGEQFNEETERLPCDIGDFYATQSWHNTATGDGRRVQAAWMRGAQFPDMPFNQQITFPCELSLRKTKEGLRVYRKPIQEIESLHSGVDHWENLVLSDGEKLPLEPEGRLFHVKAEVRLSTDAELRLLVRGVPLVFSSHSVSAGPHHGNTANEIHLIEVLVDVASIETFVNDGELSATWFVLPNSNGLEVRAEGGEVQIQSLDVSPLRSIWNQPEAASKN